MRSDHLPRTYRVVSSIVLTTATAGLWAEPPRQIRVDVSRAVGKIKPLHGVNNGPPSYGGILDLRDRYKALSIPCARLHDCNWPTPDVVDIHVVFPDWEASPSHPGSYRFARTDEYLRRIHEAGTGIVYRLGESIEHTVTKHHVHPPANARKWAEICVGIIRHYNEGWADGVRYGIRYWEIWNEPENRPAMWTGTDAQYNELYVTAARVIKTRFPHVRVGGPSVGAPGRVVNGELEPTAFLEGFISAVRRADAPLDFFTWHTYSNNVQVYVRRARAIRRWLDIRGFSATELHLNEWNYLPDNDWGPLFIAGQGLPRERWFARQGGIEGAVFTASVLVALQDCPIDMANYYSGDSLPFGFFSRHGVPKKPYYAMDAFSKLCATPARVYVKSSHADGPVVCAGYNKAAPMVRVLLCAAANQTGAYEIILDPVPWPGATRWEMLLISSASSMEKIAQSMKKEQPVRLPMKLDFPAVVLITARPSPPVPDGR